MNLSILQWLENNQIELRQCFKLGAEVSGVAYRIVQEMAINDWTPFDICSLAEVMELPLTEANRIVQPITQITIALLRILSRKKPLKRSEGTWLTFQIAYLHALQGILKQEFELRRPWLNRGTIPIKESQEQRLTTLRLRALIKTLRPGRLSDSQAEQALSLIEDSFLVKQINSLAIAWLIFNSAEETEANLLIQRLVNGLPGYLLEVIINNSLALAQLQKFVLLGRLSNRRIKPRGENDISSSSNSIADVSIDLSREYYRAKLLKSLSEPLLGELFSLKDIHIPLKGIPVDVFGLAESNNQSKSVNLMEWLNSQLQNTSSISVIEADSGCGKTSFCQIWASWVAKELYPDWMPIFIWLKNITLGTTLEETLESIVPEGRFSDIDGWVSEKSPPCLLIFDGFDQLSTSSGQLRSSTTILLDQIIQFQNRYFRENGQPRHKIILTSSNNFLSQETNQSLIRRCCVGNLLPLQTQLQVIALQSMEQEELKQWFICWSKLQSKSLAQAYFSFLKQHGIFKQSSTRQTIASLVLQPLMLYLLGILYRDGLIDGQIFKLQQSQFQLEIYERITHWLLGKSLLGSNLLPELVKEGLAHAYRSPEAITNLLTGRQPEQLQESIQKLAFTLLQTSKWQYSIDEGHSKEESLADTTEILDDWQSYSQGYSKSNVTIAPPLPALFFRNLSLLEENQATSPSLITFSHPQLGFYLAAEEIAKQLKALTQKSIDIYGNVSFLINSPQAVAQHLYGLLGYGLLLPEIETLLMERLHREEIRNLDNFSFQVLFKRLYPFYRDYCRGRWLDEGIVHRAITKFPQQSHPVSTLYVDAAVGLNVFLLLCLTSQAASIYFSPCGAPTEKQQFESDRLLTFFHRSAILSPFNFLIRSRNCFQSLQLTGACLNRLMLAQANLEQANLSIAELIETDLAKANLKQANLSWASLTRANLSGADLSQANLEGADLSRANLLGVKFKEANLKNACLFKAQLDPANHKIALQKGAFFSWQEFQTYNQSLLFMSQTNHLPDSDFLDINTDSEIQSVEGEPILPNIWDDTFTKDKELVINQKNQNLLVEEYPAELPSELPPELPPELPFSSSQEDEKEDDDNITIDNEDTIFAQEYSPELYSLSEDDDDDDDDNDDDMDETDTMLL